MSVNGAHRLWRHLSGYYMRRFSDLLFAITCAEAFGQRRQLDIWLRKTGEDGDMQRREYLWLQSLEVINGHRTRS